MPAGFREQQVTIRGYILTYYEAEDSYGIDLNKFFNKERKGADTDRVWQGQEAQNGVGPPE